MANLFINYLVWFNGSGDNTWEKWRENWYIRWFSRHESSRLGLIAWLFISLVLFIKAIMIH
jgi:hypothetical protein